MESENLDRRITIQRKTETQNSAGEVEETWSNLLVDEPAGIKHLRGDERFSVQQLIGTSVLTFIIRFPPVDISVEDRILYDDKTWEVTDTREISRRDGLEIDTKARAL